MTNQFDGMNVVVQASVLVWNKPLKCIFSRREDQTDFSVCRTTPLA